MFPDEVVDSSMMLQLFFFVCERYSSASERIIKYQETIKLYCIGLNQVCIMMKISCGLIFVGYAIRLYKTALNVQLSYVFCIISCNSSFNNCVCYCMLASSLPEMFIDICSRRLKIYF